MSTCLSICLSVCLSVCLSICAEYAKRSLQCTATLGPGISSKPCILTSKIMCTFPLLLILLSSSPPLLPQVTGEPLTRRSDDNEDTLRKRLLTYHTQTKPLVEYYQKQGIHTRVDASQSSEKVFLDVEAIFKRCTAARK